MCGHLDQQHQCHQHHLEMASKCKMLKTQATPTESETQAGHLVVYILMSPQDFWCTFSLRPIILDTLFMNILTPGGKGWERIRNHQEEWSMWCWACCVLFLLILTRPGKSAGGLFTLIFTLRKNRSWDDQVICRCSPTNKRHRRLRSMWLCSLTSIIHWKILSQWWCWLPQHYMKL